MKEDILEKRLLGQIVRHFPRKPAVDEPSDVELVDFDPQSNSLLAVAADSISEEIATGLYSDPYTIGWVLVMAPASDLAAAGAKLLGISTILNLPESLRLDERAELARGVG